MSVFTSQNLMGVTRNCMFKNNNEHTKRVFLTLTSVSFNDISISTNADNYCTLLSYNLVTYRLL